MDSAPGNLFQNQNSERENWLALDSSKHGIYPGTRMHVGVTHESAFLTTPEKSSRIVLVRYHTVSRAASTWQVWRSMELNSDASVKIKTYQRFCGGHGGQSGRNELWAPLPPSRTISTIGSSIRRCYLSIQASKHRGGTVTKSGESSLRSL